MLEVQKVLESKPHNPHYLNRYINFISTIRNQEKEGYQELHHICPKAKDLFPEHKDAKWNYISLTARQHIVAHIMLWKVYGGSQSQALECMLGQFNSSTNLYLSNRKIPSSTKIRYLAKARETASGYRSVHHLGKGVYKNDNGDRFYLKTDDPLIQELNLVGLLTGHTMTEESKDKMRGDRVTTLFYKGSIETKTIKINDPDYQKNLDAHLRLGWEIERSEESQSIIAKDRYEKVSKAMAGVTAMYYPNGTYYGKIPKDSPIVKELELIHLRSEKQTETALRAAKRAREVNLGSTIYNNGIEERKFHSAPDSSQWKEGRLPRSEEYIKNQKTAVSSRIGGSKTYNDGIRNYRVPMGGFVDSSWSPGMAPQGPRKKRI